MEFLGSLKERKKNSLVKSSSLAHFRRVQFYSGTNEGLEGVLVNFLVFMDVDGASDGPWLVEQVRGVIQRSTLEECHFHMVLVGLARADAAVVGPDWSSRRRRLYPLPLFNNLRIRFPDEPAHFG